MGLRKDVLYMSKIHWEPRIPSEEIIIEQAKNSIKHGRSTGNINLDIAAFNSIYSNERTTKKEKTRILTLGNKK